MYIILKINNVSFCKNIFRISKNVFLDFHWKIMKNFKFKFKV